ncbi:hypothetical protein AB9P05_18740 [Roseivirga sp. BDSF3-8]|uniref:hypothetical protein n=1 Tax=Roseivirga sp. BDSF3-8 TaxID=3241598 RepID=UPI0035322CBA
MGLAYLEFLGDEGPGGYRFHADTGDNRWYQYLIGSEEDVVNREGIHVLQNAAHVSSLQQTPQNFRGFPIEVPSHLLSRENNRVQLLSFRTRDKTGPAISDIVTAIPMISDIDKYEFTMNAPIHPQKQERRRVPFRYREVTSGQMSVDWMQLLEVVPGLLESATPIVQAVSGLVTGVAGGINSSTSRPSAPASPVVPPAGPHTAITPEMIQALIAALQQAGQQVSPPAAPAQSASYKGFAGQMDMGAISGPLLASVAPAILQNLPQLLQTAAPVLQQVLSPETIQALGDPAQLNQLMNHLMDSFLEADRVRQESMDRNRANRLQFFRQANPIIQQYLTGRAVASSTGSNGRKAIKIEFTEGKPVTLLGRPRIIYVPGGEIRFPFVIDGITYFPKAIGQIRIVTTESNTPVLEKRIRIRDLTPGETVYELKLTAEETADLPRDEDLMLDLTLKMREEGGKVRTSRKIHRFRISPEYLFDRVQQSNGGELPLNDVVEYREYWHKVWEADMKDKVRRYYLEGKYYTLPDHQEEQDAIMDTKLKSEEDKNRGHRAYYKFKSGMLFSMYRLNALIPRLTGQASLPPELLEAIRSPEVARHFRKAARAEAAFRGDPGETVTLWAYPVLAMHEIVLKKPLESDVNGQVTSFAEEVIDFPVPVAMHFVGTISQSV